jgi:hypothetical protein
VSQTSRLFERISEAMKLETKGRRKDASQPGLMPLHVNSFLAQLWITVFNLLAYVWLLGLDRVAVHPDRLAGRTNDAWILAQDSSSSMEHVS